MIGIPDPLKIILRDFCNVEWYETHELANLIGGGNNKFNKDFLKFQMDELIISENPPLDEINNLTANEFESIDEMRVWLKLIRSQVFGD